MLSTAFFVALSAAPAPDAFAGVKPGQHYVYALWGTGSLDEEILALDASDLTVRVKWRRQAGQPMQTATRKVPRDVAWFVKTYRPEVGLFGYGEQGYDAAYFRAMMGSHPYDHDPMPQEVKGPTRFAVPGGRFTGTLAEGSMLARTQKGCVLSNWRKVRSPRYPFTLEDSSNGTPTILLQAVR